jgi:predicted nucleic acid-binding protein
MITFIDTNVFLYAIDSRFPAKQARAIARIQAARQAGAVWLSTQVLQEFYNIATRKFQPALSSDTAATQLRNLCTFNIAGADAGTVLAATAFVRDYQLSWWDALILEAALRVKADVLLSEDGQTGQRYGALVRENPFV